ncbi:hypothetical protein K9M09_01610 [Patescibacteria group bacterium]|nr:hypothetical protein [Patescibacteria group bacterium]
MFDYLQQFNKLPKELRDKVSSPAAMEILSSLESKYKVNLAMLVMQIMVKQVLIKDLTAHLITEMSLSPEQAQALNQELQEKLFFSVATYLGLKMAPPLSPEEKELVQLMKDNAIILPSSDLMNRCRQILLTYRKGVRTKIDVRAALERDVNQGGLGLDAVTADRLLRALDLPATTPPVELARPQASAELNNLIKQQDGSAYDLKSAIAGGKIKAPAALAGKFKQQILDTKHELEAPVDELEIAAPAPTLSLQEAADNTPEKADSQHNVSGTNKTLTDDRRQSVPVMTPNQVAPAVVKLGVSEEANKSQKIIDQKIAIDKVKDEAVPVMGKNEALAAQAAATSNAKLKEATLENLKPEAATNRSFKKAPSELSGLWAKLFKEQANKTINSKHGSGPVSLSSNHLEEAVKAAVKEAAISARPAASSESRTKIEDVKMRPKVMGPLEELRYLDLVNFRRLGATPKEITVKIVNKIHLLEKDGYDRMVEGVKAWRQSPVNRLYVRLAQEAVVSGMTLRETIANRQVEKKESLSMEEIEAIVLMNNQLMF